MAFQSSAFQNTAFQDTGSSSNPTVNTYGWISDKEYKKYRKKLESVLDAANSFDRKKVISEVEDVIDIIELTNISLPEITKISKQVEQDNRIEFDFTAISKQAKESIKRLEHLIEMRELMEMESNDEEALLILI